MTLILAGKESEGVGAAIKAGPTREGWRGAARGVGAHADLAPRDEGAAWRGPWVRASSFSLWLPSSASGGASASCLGSGKNRSQTRPMWSAAGVPDPSASSHSGPVGGLRALPGKGREFPSRGIGGCAVSFPSVGMCPPKQLRGSSRLFNAYLFFMFSEGENCNE